MYLTIGNIEKSVRRKPSNRATVLLGYLPSSKLKCFAKDQRSVHGWQLFHYCMRRILDGLVNAGADGVDMLCADGYLRRVFPILAAYVADYPEQCLVTCCKKGWCPKCVKPRDELGDLSERVQSLHRDPEETKILMRRMKDNLPAEAFYEQGLRPLFKPF